MKTGNTTQTTTQANTTAAQGFLHPSPFTLIPRLCPFSLIPRFSPFTLLPVSFPLLPCLTLFLLMLSIVPKSHAAGNENQSALELLSLINEARRAPLTMAASLGMDPAKVMADLPELQGILETGLPELQVDSRLTAAAEAHTQDMLANGYYASTSPDGQTLFDRLSAAGYQTNLAGEKLAMLSFFNFIDPDRAVRQLFTNMFVDELNPSRTEPRYILSADMHDAGIAVYTGKKSISGKTSNVYLATCDFGGGEIGEDVLARMDSELIALMNQARVKPAAVGSWLELDMHGCGDNLPHLLEGLAPLASDQRLAAVAQSRLEQMAAAGFAGDQALIDSPVTNNLAAAGYNAVAVRESTAWVKAADYLDPESAVQVLFAQMITRETGSACAEPAMFYPEANAIGAGIRLVELTDEGGASHLYYLCDVVLAQNQDQVNPVLMGLVFDDADGNGLYSPGEGIADRAVIYFDNGLQLRTDIAGCVQAAVEPGWELIVLHSTTENMRFIEKNIEKSNVWFDIDLSEQ